MYDLIVCVRCHHCPGLTEDTLDAIEQSVGPRTLVIAAVDNNSKMADRLGRQRPGRIYLSGQTHPWGPALYGLLSESIRWAEKNFQFSHFMSVDYDTLFIGQQVDQAVLSFLDDPQIGLLGCYSVSKRWDKIFALSRNKFAILWGPIPEAYIPGEGCLGGAFVLTRSAISAMSARRMFEPPFSDASKFTSLADDHLLPLPVRMCGLTIRGMDSRFRIQWDLSGDPMRLIDAGVIAFHPTKVRALSKNLDIELKVRNHYRLLRGREPLRMEEVQ
jgi:hypothetical protein